MYVDDLTRLKHMRDAARELAELSHGKHRSDLATDRQFSLAMMKVIEIVGEAASRITKETQGKYPMIPWQQITGMRNRLIHVYFDIDLDFVWEAAIVSAPKLIQDVEQAISDLERVK